MQPFHHEKSSPKHDNLFVVVEIKETTKRLINVICLKGCVKCDNITKMTITNIIFAFS